MNLPLHHQIQQAVHSFQQGNLVLAEQLLKNVLAIAPRNVSAMSILGLAQAQQGNVDLGVSSLTKAHKLAPGDAGIVYNLANVLMQAGRHGEALHYHKKAVRLDPGSYWANTNFAVSLAETGNVMEAAGYFKKALSLSTNNPQAWLNMSSALKQVGDFEQGLRHVDRALELDPEYVDAWVGRGEILFRLKRNEDALASCDRALEKNASHSGALSAKGLMLCEMLRLDEALGLHEKAVICDSSSAVGWYNKAVSLERLGRKEEALLDYEKAIALVPTFAEAWGNKGVVLNSMRMFDAAITHYGQAIHCNPNYAEAYSNRGVSLHSLRRFDEAIADFDRAIALNSAYAEAWSNKGISLRALRRYDEAMANFDAATRANPEYADGWFNMGSLLQQMKQYETALACYLRVRELQPEYDYLQGNIVYLNMLACRWDDYEKDMDAVIEGIQSGLKVVAPFYALSIVEDPELLLSATTRFSADAYPGTLITQPEVMRHADGKIRIGYFSGDLREHAVSFLMAEVFELHDRERFHTIAFYSGPNVDDGMKRRVTASFDEFIDISEMNDADTVAVARGRGINIAVDLSGYTDHARTAVFASRVAPVQASYIGYLGTMGASYYDYLFADRVLIPDASRRLYTEKIVFLPSYQANDSKRTASESKLTRADYGLPAEQFVYCSFNNNFKFSPDTFDSWMRILTAVDDSVLFLYADTPLAESNLKQEAARRGICTSRLIFANRVSRAEYLARYGVVDLFLDTAPYNAGTTASDALWMGVPVITKQGVSFASRMASSLLHAIGLAELVTYSSEEYEKLAITLAKQPAKLASVRELLVKNREDCLLFDSRSFVRNLETAYLSMYDRSLIGVLPDDLYI